jgi:hypothetical protein
MQPELRETPNNDEPDTFEDPDKVSHQLYVKLHLLTTLVSFL